MLRNILIVSAGGIIGTLSRYLVYIFIENNFASAWYKPLIVNIVGGAIVGLLWKFIEFHPDRQLFLLIGVLGAFTTFSSFILDTYLLIQVNKIGLAALSILLNNTLSFLSFFCGLYVSRLISAI